jgi:hypothetical protein
MERGRFASESSIFLGMVVLLSTLPSSAQTPTGMCCCDAHGHAVRCTARSGNTGSDSSSYSGPSDAEIEAEHQREAERKRLEELQRQQEIERQRQEAEQERARQEWLAAVKDAAGHLKGVSQGGTGLKGVSGNTAFFGLKGVSPDEAAANINTTSPDRTFRDVSTASKQLTCAADITNYALKHVSSLIAGAGSQADLDEIKYLAGEASNALQGNPIGVQCNSSGALRFTKAPDLKTITPAYKARLDKMIGDSQALYSAEQQASLAQQKIDDAKKRMDDLKAQRGHEAAEKSTDSQSSTKPGSSNGDSTVDKAYAEQRAWQQKDQERINQVYEEQKKLQQQQFDALALLRKAQAEYNAVNSQKVSETKALVQDAKAIGQLESGNALQQ